MSAIKYADNLLLFRSIQRELKHLCHKSAGVKDDAATRYMLNVMRGKQAIEGRPSRPQGHYKYLAENYLIYLRSSRQQDELVKKYFNKGDRSVEDSARLVGLKLPNQA